MPLVAFDSNISIWCIKEECTPGQEAEMYAAVKLRRLLTKLGYDILIPIPVVSELLSNIADISKRQQLYNEIRKTFQIGEFDAKSAILLAEILNYHYVTSNKQYQSLGIHKTALKYDALIVAASKSHGAECLFAFDKDCKKIAVHFLPVKSVFERPDSINQNIGMYEKAKRELEIELMQEKMKELGNGETIVEEPIGTAATDSNAEIPTESNEIISDNKEEIKPEPDKAPIKNDN